MGRHKNQARKRHRSGLNPAWQVAKIDLAGTKQERELGLIRSRHFEFSRVVEADSTHFATGEQKVRRFQSGTFREMVADQLFFTGVPTNSRKPHDSCSFAIKVGDGIKFTER